MAMKFGFNVISIEAEEALSKDGLRIVREDEHHVSVYTDIATSEIEHRDIEHPRHEFGNVLPGQGDYQTDMAKQMVANQTRCFTEKVCDCPDNSQVGGFYRCTHPRRYYYLLGSHVYTCIPVRRTDNATTPPTIYEVTTLELVTEAGSVFFDKLRSLDPMIKGTLF